MHCSSAQGIYWDQSSNCSKAQPEPGQPGGSSCLGTGEMEIFLTTEGKVWVCREGGGSREEQNPIYSWGMPGGKLHSRAEVAGQNKQGRSPSAEFRTCHRGAQKALLGAFVPDGHRFFPLSSGCSCSSSNGCDLCRLLLCSQCHRI